MAGKAEPLVASGWVIVCEQRRRVGTYDDSMIIRSGWNFSALQSQRGVDEGDRMLDGAPKISRSADFI